jgi:hypothetical protein
MEQEACTSCSCESARQTIHLKDKNGNIFCTKILVYEAETPTSNRFSFPYAVELELSCLMTGSLYQLRNSSIGTTLNLIQAFYPKFLDLENSETMLALDRLDPSLSTLCLLLDTHRLGLGAHDSGSAYEQSVVDIDVLALCKMWHKVASVGHFSAFGSQDATRCGVDDRDGGCGWRARVGRLGASLEGQVSRTK